MNGLRQDLALWIQCGCTALVALRFGADTMTASIWPLIVDGLLTTATVELWKPSRDGSSRWPAWSAFIFGISLSLCANIASAPVTSAFGVAVAACPPLALLLAVELLNRALKRHRTESPSQPSETGNDRGIPELNETKAAQGMHLVTPTDQASSPPETTAGRDRHQSHLQQSLHKQALPVAGTATARLHSAQVNRKHRFVRQSRRSASVLPAQAGLVPAQP